MESGFVSKDPGRVLYRMRKERGLSQREVARGIGASSGYICNMERGRTGIGIENIIRYAEYFGITLDLLTGYLIPDYLSTALDNELMRRIHGLSEGQKARLLILLLNRE